MLIFRDTSITWVAVKPVIHAKTIEEAKILCIILFKREKVFFLLHCAKVFFCSNLRSKILANQVRFSVAVGVRGGWAAAAEEFPIFHDNLCIILHVMYSRFSFCGR